MCGRFALNRALGQLRQQLRVRGVVSHGHDFQPSNNIAPGDYIPVLRNQEIHIYKWGTTYGENFVINARSETAVDKFSAVIKKNRCVVPASGYFEWNKEKQPFFFHKESNELLFLAAFYNQNDEVIILTRPATEALRSVHERMPIILTLEEAAKWEGSEWEPILAMPAPTMQFHPVSKVSLRPGYTGQDCVTPITLPSGQKTLFDVLKTKKE